MMNEGDRKKVFWLLKKYSSYTAWKALGDAYAEFAKAYEYAIHHSEETDEDASEWDRDHFKRILNGQIAFEKGLPLLREGQRSVFRRASTGYLRRAAGAINFINRIMDPEEFVFDWMVNKDEVVAATNKLLLRGRGLGAANEPGNELYEDERVAALGQQTVFDPFYGPFNIPRPLSGVPAPTDITVNTGKELSHTGVWEPEWEISPGLLKSLTGTPAKLEKGCMNYLLAGTIAPKYKDGELEPEINVAWRLIWADHRYEDGIIPEEEAEYLAEATPAPHQERLRGLPNELVPQTGWWWSPAFIGTDALRHFNQGEHFPPTETTNYGGVFWYYDADRQPKE